jgi:single-strand DNA-binding protein
MREIECAAEVRVASDPEMRTSKAGKPYARFRAVVGDGEAAQWLQVTAIGEKALEGVASLVKGDRAYVEGSIKLDRWTGTDGVERGGLGVMAWKVVPLGKIGRARPPKPRTQPDGARHWQQPALADARPVGSMAQADEFGGK